MNILFFNNMECFSIESCVRSYPSIMRFGKSMLKKNCHVNVRMATVLICSGFAVNERYIMASLICSARVSIFSSLFTSLSTHARWLKKEDPVDLGHCQRDAGGETEPNLSSSICETSWVKNFSTKIMKISIP